MGRLLTLISLLCAFVLVIAAAQPSGTISASPNPCTIEPGKKLCATDLTWSTQNVAHARVYVVTEGSSGKEERVFSQSSFCQKCSAPWIENHPYSFTLYDYSNGNRGRALGSVTVSGRAEGAPAATAATGEPSGRISASPNPCTIERGKKTCTTNLTWSSENVRHARVYVVAEGSRGREENLFSGARSCQSCPAPWIERGPYTFTLYDYSNLTRGRALGSVSVTGRQQ